MAKQPDGVEAPLDGSLPSSALATINDKPFAFYIHVPFCTTRCGYCDFNTYTSEELGEGVTRQTWSATAIREVQFAKKVLGATPAVSTIFIGGGTPTLLPAADLLEVVAEIEKLFDLADDCEITIESNPDSVTLENLQALRAGGVNRISFGMQSAAPHVLQVLERTHRTGSIQQAVSWSREAGFTNVNVDMIYGTPSETIADVEKTLEVLHELNVDHVSAYALIVEEGTKLHRQVHSGEIPEPNDDDMAMKYELVDHALSKLGLDWYEVSNWSRKDRECRHNILYWQSANWWGVGPGAHSHIGGVRWWNAKHPATWTKSLVENSSPAVGRDYVEEFALEELMLTMRLRSGFEIPIEKQDVAQQLVEDGLIEITDRAVLTLRGRLLADLVLRKLLD